MNAGLRKTNRECPCPICGKPDWCSIAADGTFCICMRSPQAGRRQARNRGFIYRLTPALSTQIPPKLVASPLAKKEPVELQALSSRWQSTVNPIWLQSFSRRLTVSAGSLHRLGVGWSTFHRAWTFPMSDAQRRIMGIHLRRPDGTKLAVTGSRNGLFIPEELVNPDRLLIAEGVTDTAALLDLGFAAVGRPNCYGGITDLIDFCTFNKIFAAVVVADSDPLGIRGAEALACVLAAYCATVRIVVPPSPIKDVRQWVQHGATTRDLQSAIESAAIKQLDVSARVRRRKGGCNGH